jgi:hypothetical protein
VHTLTRFGAPFTIARTRCTFGFQRRFVRRCEWLSFMPKIGFLPHTSQTDDIGTHLGDETAKQRATDSDTCCPAPGKPSKEPGEASTCPPGVVRHQPGP